jgi:hypothetical protein
MGKMLASAYQKSKKTSKGNDNQIWFMKEGSRAIKNVKYG